MVKYNNLYIGETKMCKLFAHPGGGCFVAISGFREEDLTMGRGNAGGFETPVGAMLRDI